MRKKILLSLLFSILLVSGGIVFILNRNKQTSNAYPRHDGIVLVYGGSDFKYTDKVPLATGSTYADAIAALQNVKDYKRIYRVVGKNKIEVNPTDKINSDTKIDLS